MKKVLCLIFVLIFVVSFSACGKKDINNETSNNDSPNNSETESDVSTKPVLGEELEVEEVVIFDEDNKHYTGENLPDEYLRSDFDGDGLNNKDEIENGTDMYKVDTDGDGISDHDEIYVTKTDPTKWSTRDDGISDLEYILINGKEFEEGYTATDANGFKVYLAKAEDRLYVFSKVSTNVFDDLETISEAFQIKYFSGKIALNLNKYVDEVAQSIAIYKDINGVATKIECNIDENNLVEFELNENDIFVVVYEENK